ncbi:MAG TPA: hypothetical protein VFL86_25160 [Burkholderiaceae bacterium]|nr:hypothetical protein [Burkholderiaceae bacterium]
MTPSQCRPRRARDAMAFVPAGGHIYTNSTGCAAMRPIRLQP